jgi:hypothetical protein
LVQDAIVVGFKPDANSFVSYHFSLDPLPAVRRKELAAGC